MARDGNSPNIPPEGYVAGINRLLTYFAGHAAASARAAVDEWHTGGHSITAIVLAAAAVEAHIGEYLAMPENQTFFADEIAEWKAKIPRPYEIIKTVLRRRAKVDPSTLVWYQRLRCLFELRNHAIHYYPEIRPAGKFPVKLQDNCISKKFITPSGSEAMDWTSRLLTASVASQALATALEAINELSDALGPATWGAA